MDNPNQTPPTSIQGQENKPIANKEKKEAILKFLERNPYFRHASWFAGISEDTLRNWRDDDPEFSARCNMVRAEYLTKRINRASDEFILTHADPETFIKVDKLEIRYPKPLLGDDDALPKDNSSQEATSTE